MNRKNFIKTLGLGTVLAGIAPQLTAQTPMVTKERALRIAHLTDIHLQPEGAAPQGFTNALRYVHKLQDKPDLIVFGGDNIMDAFSKSKARTQEQWDLWNKLIAAECSIPYQSCIGNHDIWGWGSLRYKHEPLYGKQWAAEMLHLSNRYYSYELKGWKFIFLDSTFKHFNHYKAKLDEEQLKWLEAELKNTHAQTPICVVSHIPLFAMCMFMDGSRIKNNNWLVGGGNMHLDAIPIKNLFNQYKNVKLCLSGHIHLQDSIDYLGVKYLCNGAVCGRWWGGAHQEFDPAFALIDLYNDGSSEHQIIAYNWN